MQIKPISAPPAGDSPSMMTIAAGAGVFRPSRCNFAGVCLYCAKRWCESLRCAQLHERSLWAPCEDCDGFGQLADCHSCLNGVVEVDPAGLAAQANRVLPATLTEPPVFVVTALAARRCRGCGRPGCTYAGCQTPHPTRSSRRAAA
ncbi:MAG TPA: hypothetical protein VFM55_10315 [Micromonosporaceae bacterium]|nr:hypothetical protein [Micromonosporaceae bacterium]